LRNNISNINYTNINDNENIVVKHETDSIGEAIGCLLHFARLQGSRFQDLPNIG